MANLAAAQSLGEPIQDPGLLVGIPLLAVPVLDLLLLVEVEIQRSEPRAGYRTVHWRPRNLQIVPLRHLEVVVVRFYHLEVVVLNFEASLDHMSPYLEDLAP